MSKLILAIIILITSFGVQSAKAQNIQAAGEQYRYQAVRIENAPTIDGDLSDAAWEQANVIDQLVQQEPATGEPASEKTVVRVMYDAEAIYISAYCFDSEPGGVVRNTLRFRDDNIWSKDDVIRFGIDTFHDHRRGYVFSINPLGAKQDSQVDNGGWNPNWDEVWDVRTRVLDNGWTVEARIPFRIFRFPADGGGTWGFNVMRQIKRKNESSTWVPLTPSFSFARAEFYGHVEGITGVESPRNIQVVPYGLAGVTRSNGPAGNDSTVEGGADMKMAVGSALALDLTYNTNFAQVEADDQQINLTRFSLFFPEKREFFLENAALFNFGILSDTQLFFSRRIGLAGNQPVPLIGGARLSGKVGKFDLGLLTTQTETDPRLRSTNLSTGRVRYNFARQSYVGGIVTDTYSKTQSNKAYGTDVLYWLGRNLRADAFAAVVDDKNIDGRPATFSGALTYEQDLWAAGFRTLSVDKNFNPAMGYVRRDDILRHTANLRKSWRLNREAVRRLNLISNVTYLTDKDNVLDTRTWNFEVSDEINSGDVLRFQASRNFERIFADDDPFVLNPRKGVVVPAGDYNFNRWFVQYQRFDGRALVPGIKFERGEFYGGNRSTATLTGIWRPSPHLVLQGDYEYNDISLPQGAFAAHLWRARFTIPITARSLVDAFVQWNGLNQQGDREINTQVRFHLIYGKDSNLFVVFSDQRRARANGITALDQGLQAKMTYRLYW
jgi:hypothetical protein